MANASVVPSGSPEAILSGIKSLQDAAYQQAKAGDATEAIARYVMDREPGFPDEMSDEGKAALVAGYRMRFHERRPAQVFYRVSEALYVPEGDFKGDTAKAEKVTVTVNYALSFSTHDFGRMADTHGAQFKGIIGAVREATSTYVSNRTSDLKRMVTRLKNEGKTRTRGATLKFSERVDAVLKDLQTKCANANAKGDPEADKARLTRSIAAFKAEWTKA
jgi:hypothetical protein